MRTIKVFVVLAGLAVGSACSDLTVPDYNNPGLDELTTNPTRSAVLAAATGLLVGTREGVQRQNGYLSLLGIIGRESYNFDAADPRFITQMLIGPLDGGTPAFGGNLCGAPYANMRGADILLRALDAVTGMSDEEKASTRGFAKTIMALDLLNVINTRDALGAVVDVTESPTGEPAPVASKTEVFTRIESLLDDAVTDLGAGGTTFPFPLSSGFTGFDTPATFVAFNRSLRARVAVYAGDFGGALTALASSFVSGSASLDLGVYHAFSTGSGDQTNLLYDPEGAAIVAHPSIETDAQLKGNGQPDDRFTRKTFRLTAPATDQASQGMSTTLGFQVYPGITAPVPIIRNEELILLRAEANLGLGQDAPALTDINLIRATSGGLDPIDTGVWAGLSDADQLTELLYNKRYSLLFEGHRWIDVRRYDRLSTLPRDVSGHAVFPYFPFPVAECLSRTSQPGQGCSPVSGIP